MRKKVIRTPRRASWLASAAAVPMTIVLGATFTPAVSNAVDAVPSGAADYLQPPAPAAPEPIKTEHPTVAGLPGGVKINRVEWLSSRRIAIFIDSAVMPGKPIQVQMLLARDWYSNPQRSFPSVWMLDGLRALDTENGWTMYTNIEQFYADKNINVILPVGGESSFYSDWQKKANGKEYKWESFLINELIPVLRAGYRTNDDRGAMGISMGATAAINLAEAHPELFKFAGSFSGYLDTTSVGMPEAIKQAQKEAGGYNSEDMWGPVGSDDWKAHDPKRGVDKLKNVTTYVSAGSGRDDFGQPGSPAVQASNYMGVGLEIVSRMTSQTFTDIARDNDVKVITAFRPSGVHDWPYWQFEVTQAWPHLADSLGMTPEDRGANCVPVGDIAKVVKSGILGACVTNEYPVRGGGKVEDFVKGRAYWSPETGAHALYGRINARYSEIGGPESWLGYPISEEKGLANGTRFVRFEHGSMYWNPKTGSRAVPDDLVRSWGETGWENGDLGLPVTDPIGMRRGLIQYFENGSVVRNEQGKTFWLRGVISNKYRDIKGAMSPLGFPVTNEQLIKGGAFQEFENGFIYWSPDTGANVIMKGDIFQAWGKTGYETGPYGFPAGDQAHIPAGGETMPFQHGVIEQINGQINEKLNK